MDVMLYATLRIQDGGAEMIYMVIVDGKSVEVEASIGHYSLENDNKNRERIIRHFLDDEGAKSVVIKTTTDEVRRFCREV